MKKAINLSIDIALLIKADQAGLKGQYSRIFEEALLSKLSDKGYIIQKSKELENKIAQLERVKQVMGEAQIQADTEKEEKITELMGIVNRNISKQLPPLGVTAIEWWSKEIGVKTDELRKIMQERLPKPPE